MSGALAVLLTVPLGALAQVLVFFALRRFAGIGALAAAVVVALAALALYLPYALVSWPGGDVVAMHLAIYLVVAYGLALIFDRLDQQAERARFHWAPAVIIGFFVLLVLIDGVLVVVSDRGLPGELAGRILPEPRGVGTTSTAFPGVVARDYQKKESYFNAFLDQLREQTERGWQVRKGWLGEPVVDRPARFQVEVLDAVGHPLSGVEIRGRFLRPSNIRLDQELALNAVGEGRYQAEVVLPAPGRWQLQLEIQRGGERHTLTAATDVARATD